MFSEKKKVCVPTLPKIFGPAIRPRQVAMTQMCFSVHAVFLALFLLAYTQRFEKDEGSGFPIRVFN